MRRNKQNFEGVVLNLDFIRKTISLIVLGVVLGLLGRFFFGEPVDSSSDRRFHHPVEGEAAVNSQFPNFPLDKFWTD
ncbi:MAG: hypothetical protein AAGA30_20945 [Planctomycetota bacterium]